MEFLFVPIIFAIALLLLSLGKLFGGKEIHGSCKGRKSAHGEDLSCGACSGKDKKISQADDKAGLQNIAKLGYPSRKQPYNEKADFKPEQFN